jgi:sugar phosphate isomerase/epimerase
MEFGICTSLDNAATLRSTGWDYVEESVQSLLKGQAPDEQWEGLARARSSPLPVPAANLLVPAALKITGPGVDSEALTQYIARVTARAKRVGIEILVFGSGGARNVPEGFDRGQAAKQIKAFLRTCSAAAAKDGVTIVVEPLNRKECNIINSVAEAMQYVSAVAHPNIRCLVDTYHLWLEDEPLENVQRAIGQIAHVHVADREGRVAPGESGKEDYRPLFRILKRGGYDRRISVEGNFPEPAIRERGARVLDYLKRQWQEA